MNPLWMIPAIFTDRTGTLRFDEPFELSSGTLKITLPLPLSDGGVAGRPR